MHTITIQVEPYLACYMYKRFETALHGRAVRFSCNENFYHVLLSLTRIRPQGVSGKEKGNLTMVIPKPAHGKHPEKFNYLGKEGVDYLERMMETRMNVELFEFLLKRKEEGFSYSSSAYLFWEEYQLEGIDPESLRRRFDRWREKCKKQK